MARKPRIPKNTDKFADLDSDYKDAVAQSSPEEIYKRLADIAREEEELATAKDLDTDLKSKAEAANTAREPYKRATKEFRLKKQFALRVLGDKGKV